MDESKMTFAQLPSLISLVAIYIVYGTTFTLAGGMKVLDKTVPAWFSDQFSKTFLASFPGLSAAYWTIAFLECTVPVFLVISLVRMEFLPGHELTFLSIAVAVAAIIFGILGFGLRLVNDFQGAANSFFYFAAAIVTQIYLQNASR